MRILMMMLLNFHKPNLYLTRLYFSVVLLICILASGGCKSKQEPEITEQQKNTLNSLTKIDNYPFYTMHYDGDYGLKQYLDTGTMPKFSQNAEYPAGCLCTCFSAFGINSSYIFGRNYDWHNHTALLLFTHPSDGFASISMVDIGVSGYSETNTPDSHDNRNKLLETPYLCVDGMNECGVAIAEMSVPHAEPPYSASKKSINADVMIRVVLDYAKNAEDALQLIKSYNINFDYGEKVHYLIADSSGNSMIVEFVNNEVKAIRNTNPWQVSTNFIFSGTVLPPLIDYGYNDADSFDRWRYVKASLTLQNKKGCITIPYALDLLKTLSANFGAPYNITTQWSAAYDLKNRAVSLVINRNTANVYRFSF